MRSTKVKIIVGVIRLDELKLIYEAKKGNKEALNKLIEENIDILAGFVFKMTGDFYLSQDIVQETLLKAIININKFTPKAKFSTWLIKIAINVYKDFLKKNKHHSVSNLPSKGEQKTEENFMSTYEYRQILDAIQNLPYKFRVVFVLKHFYGYKYQEIAKILHCPVGTVRSRLHYAVKFLVDELKKRGILDHEDEKI